MDNDKLKEIQARIKELKPADNSNSKPISEISAFTIAVDLVSGTMVGVVGGILTDKFFHSKPLFLILFTVLGMIAGFNIIRKKLNNKKQ
ncbi:MAG TPA: AtpZ/AtpI family protein [Rickettsia endosymbiont of Pyrocoelia pectoralis]|nr:AtpZ/AtpI family protein [Rickettsia endosymbiont of Pyrocoelia pectoralis]